MVTVGDRSLGDVDDRIITCVETYVRFVEQDGRSPDQYRAFVARTVRETVFVG